MKNILLITGEHNDRVFQFDTTQEAMAYADTLIEERNFHIYSLYQSGTTTGISWEIATDPATNLRELAKTAKQKEVERRKAHKGRTGVWTAREIETAVAARKKGMLIRQIADKLGRSYNSVYCKFQQLGVTRNR